MGMITPIQMNAKKPSSSKKLISDFLKKQALEEIAVPTSDGDTVIMPRAQALGMRLFDTALFSKSEKTAATAAKLILEYIEGKPAVQEDTTVSEIPAVKFVLQADDKKKLELLADKEEEEEPNDSGVFHVDLGNGEACEIPVDECEVEE